MGFIKKWQKRLMEAANSLSFVSKMESGSLTADEQKELFAKYEEIHGVSFLADKEADEDLPKEEPTLSTEAQKELASIFGDKAPKTQPEVVNTVKEQQTTIEDQKKDIEALKKEPEAKTPVAVIGVDAQMAVAKTMAIVRGHVPHTATHLFGIEDPMFARGKWHTELTINRTPVQDLTASQKEDFRASFSALCEAVSTRSAELHSKNMEGLLDYKQLISGESVIDYSDLFGKAGEYVVRRTDAILAYLRSRPSVGHIFPVVSNVQNKEIASGANFGELSQGFRDGKHFKGSVRFTAEIYKVDSVMFQFLFQKLYELEKQYIGYLNREGSNVIKWTFIEWIMVNFGEILINEQNRRRVIGVRTPQQKVTANPAMLAADGALRAVERVEEDLKILPNQEIKSYTQTTIVDIYELFWDWVDTVLDSMQGYKLYANAKHKSWYTRAFRKKYGKDTDFSGVTKDQINDVDANIIWVPNRPMNDYKLIITFEGNIENYEDKPNEMLMFYFERDWMQVGSLSTWKEGSGVKQAGIQYKTIQELEASEHANQWIFTNDPATELDADKTTVNAKLNNVFKTGANTAESVLTDIENFDINRVVKIICGSTENATIIKKEGKFAGITADWQGKKVGDYIKFYAELKDYEEVVEGETVIVTRHTGNFLELERRSY